VTEADEDITSTLAVLGDGGGHVRWLRRSLTGWWPRPGDCEERVFDNRPFVVKIDWRNYINYGFFILPCCTKLYQAPITGLHLILLEFHHVILLSGGRIAQAGIAHK
jgi:hypothetical protein